MFVSLLRQSLGLRVRRSLQLHDHAGESLRQRVVNVAGHAITFRNHGRLTALLRQTHQLKRQHRLMSQRPGEFDFLVTKSALLLKADRKRASHLARN